VKKFILLTATLFAISVSFVSGQKRNAIKPPSETASLTETQQWLIAVLGKYASSKTRMETVSLSNIKFEGCSFNFTQTRKWGSVSSATMGATRTTDVAKNDISIDLAKVRPDGIALEDHLYPELENIKFWYAGFDLTQGSTDGRIFYVVVKREAADAIKSALIQIQRLCKAK
jgi:hypothetical protein